MSTVEKLKKQIAALSFDDREEIVWFLMHLQGYEWGHGEDPEWLAELDRRAEELRSGRDPGVPAEQVFAELRRKYGEANSVPAKRAKRTRQGGRLLRKDKARART
jgi:putative addiction module component (TIGR02574 family)